MYTFDPKTLEIDVKNFDHEDFRKNKIKYDKLERLTNFKNGGNLMIAKVPLIDQQTGGYSGTSHYYLISTLGAEFCKIDDIYKFKNDYFKINGKLMRLDYERITLNKEKEIYYQSLWEEFRTMLYEHICSPIVEASAKELDLINYIPDGVFVEYPEIEQKITLAVMDQLIKQSAKNESLSVKEQKKGLIDNLQKMKNTYKKPLKQRGEDE